MVRSSPPYRTRPLRRWSGPPPPTVKDRTRPPSSWSGPSTLQDQTSQQLVRPLHLTGSDISAAGQAPPPPYRTRPLSSWSGPPPPYRTRPLSSWSGPPPPYRTRPLSSWSGPPHLTGPDLSAAGQAPTLQDQTSQQLVRPSPHLTGPDLSAAGQAPTLQDQTSQQLVRPSPHLTGPDLSAPSQALPPPPPYRTRPLST